MIATARLAAGTGGRILGLRSEPPLSLRPTPDGVYLVGSAAGPLGGDDVRLEIDVEPGASLVIRSAAASVALPGPAPSTLTVHARVGAGAELRWLVEPTVAARGCRHRIDARIDLAIGARLHWIEEIILGRHGEPSGSVVSRFSVDLDGWPLLRHELALGPDHPHAQTSAAVGDARAVGTVVVIGGSGPTRPAVFGGWSGAGRPPRHPAPSADPTSLFGPAAAVLPLAGCPGDDHPGFQVVALAADRPTLRRLLDDGISLSGGTSQPGTELRTGVRDPVPSWLR